MKNRLILVEGVPGSGKTTIADKINNYLGSNGAKVKLFNEGDAHPADLGWMACIPLHEYESFLQRNPAYENRIRNHTQCEEEYAFVAYTALGFGEAEIELLKYFEAHEVYDGKVDLGIFTKLHLDRWRRFAESTDDSITIFECAFLQNHINELMGFYNKDTDFIYNYLSDLIKTVDHLNPKLIYLSQPDVRQTIARAAEERVSSDINPGEDWIDFVIGYVENSLYGKLHGLKGFEGAVKFFEARKGIELSIIDRIQIDKVVIDNPVYDWNEVWRRILSVL